MKRFKNTDKVTLNFTHLKTKEPCIFTFEKNPLTNDWLELQNGKKGYFYPNKKDASDLIKSIEEINLKNNLSFEMIVEPSRYWIKE